MQGIWFVYNHSSVQGPFTQQELVELVRNAAFCKQDLVWRKGQKDWLTVERWIAQNPSSVEASSSDQVQDLTEAWYVSYKSFQTGPFSFAQLVEKLQSREFHLASKVWTDGLNRWVPVLEAEAVIDALGLTRRNHLRVPLVGKATLINSTEGFDRQNIELLTVSQGGFGVKMPLEPGQLLNVRLESPLLSYPVQAQARVVYASPNDSGLQFTHVSSEMHSAVVEYINQFKGLEEPKVA